MWHMQSSRGTPSRSLTRLLCLGLSNWVRVLFSTLWFPLNFFDSVRGHKHSAHILARTPLLWKHASPSLSQASHVMSTPLSFPGLLTSVVSKTQHGYWWVIGWVGIEGLHFPLSQQTHMVRLVSLGTSLVWI